jgi:hypothetical protein
MCRLSGNLGASTCWNPQGLSGPVMGLLYLLWNIQQFVSLLLCRRSELVNVLCARVDVGMTVTRKTHTQFAGWGGGVDVNAVNVTAGGTDSWAHWRVCLHSGAVECTLMKTAPHHLTPVLWFQTPCCRCTYWPAPFPEFSSRSGRNTLAWFYIFTRHGSQISISGHTGQLVMAPGQLWTCPLLWRGHVCTWRFSKYEYSFKNARYSDTSVDRNARCSYRSGQRRAAGRWV